MSKFQQFKLPTLLATAVSLALTSALPSANAQESGLRIEEIVVTARKRDETLLEVPLTITVISSEDIALKGIDNLSDIVDFAPGLFYGGPSGGNADRSSRRLLMRGMQPSTDRQLRQAASVFIDGAPVLGAEIGDTAGAERIEVIKGPQSAYFGRSTFGGAINIITKTPGNEWQGKVSAEAGSWGTSDFGLELEGALVPDKLTFRVSANSDSSDGQYTNYANPSETLGARSTEDFSLTLYATPSDRFTARLRLHYWEDDDGETPSIAYGVGNGEDQYNCNRGGTAGPMSGVPGDPNWICGTPRFPRESEIARDSIVTDEIRAALRGDYNPGATLVLPGFLDHFGLRREAFEASLILDYEFENGMTISSITAAHSNDQSRLGDFDYRWTAAPRPGADVAGVSARILKDFSQEIRLASSADRKLQWMIGASYFDIEEELGSAFRVFSFPAPSPPHARGPEKNTGKTSALFGSISYDFNDKFTLSVEARQQQDKVSKGFPRTITLGETFDAFTPRVILDYKPTEQITLYASFAQGTRPGDFNPALVTASPEDLACISAAIGADIFIPEEDLNNYEAGFKSLLWDGRASVTVAVYKGEWRNMHTRGEVQCPQPNGMFTGFQSTGLGGSSNLTGLEVEVLAAVTEHLTLEATFALNDTEILSRDSNDAGILLGVRELAGLGNQFSRYPRISGTASGTYRGTLTDTTGWFARLDYIFKDGKWATDANLTKTPKENRFNLRVGLEVGENLRLEAYCTNLTDDDAFTGFQAFNDLSFFGRRRVLTIGLPVKRAYGARATYRFSL